MHNVASESKEFSFHLTDEEIAKRKLWLELGAQDEELLTSIVHELVHSRIDEMMERMYGHFLSFEDTRSFFPDPKVVERAKSAQADYFRRLTGGNYGKEYVDDRLRVGNTHNRIQLDPKWYLGAYNHALGFLIPILLKGCQNDVDKQTAVVIALMKLIFFDMGLAIESYISAKEYYIKKHRDIIRELETEKRVTQGILGSAPIGIITLDDQFVCLECNNEFVEIVEVEGTGAVIGKSLFDIAPNLKKLPFEEVLRSGQPHRSDAQLLKLSQSAMADQQYWDWAAWPVKNDTGRITGLVAMFANATDRVLLQQQREDFVATLTHDLKTPVLATNRAIKFLLDGDFGEVLEPQKEILETIHQSNAALYSLVQTLLDVYRFDSGVKEMHMKSCNLAAIVTQMVTEIMPLAHEKEVELKATLPGDASDVSCDEAEIRRVLQNLMDNSLKFTPTGGCIAVTMTQSEGKTRISVADTGKGISEENKPKLFQRFWQAGSTGRYYASTGLGLYLSRRIVEGHGGKIWCESELGKGSTFSFEF